MIQPNKTENLLLSMETKHDHANFAFALSVHKTSMPYLFCRNYLLPLPSLFAQKTTSGGVHLHKGLRYFSLDFQLNCTPFCVPKRGVHLAAICTTNGGSLIQSVLARMRTHFAPIPFAFTFVERNRATGTAFWHKEKKE